MTRFRKSSRILLLFLLIGAVGAEMGCRRRAAEVAEYQDPHPLPAEPFVRKVQTPGRYGGRFVLGQTQNPRTFNAMMANEASSNDINNLTYSSLVGYDNETQEIEPGLAKTWEVAPDGLTWTFHLRKGAAFSDGHPMTAQDVLFSFQVAFDPTLHPSVQDLLKMGDKFYEVSAPDRLHLRGEDAGTQRRSRAHGWRRPDHAEAHPRGTVQGRHLRVGLQRRHAARAACDERGLARDAVRARRKNGARTEPLLVRRRPAEPSPPLPQRDRLSSWCPIATRRI